VNTFGLRTLLISGLFVAMQALQAVPAHAGPPLCNGAPNGIIDGDEQCETGPCCTAKCELKSAATVCRPSADGTCDPAESCGEQAPAVDAACPADVVAADGTSCDDGDFCNVDEVCTGGVCGGGAPNTCDDANDCTEDSCNEGADSCRYTKARNGSSCEDGSACTSDDTCGNGVCLGGTPTVCEDDNSCTDDSCDADTGGCVFTNNTAPCDDGQFCTVDDVCAGGTCGGAPNACGDDDACTTDSCDEETDSCGHGSVADGTPCDDGQFCTVDDVCTGGVCVGGGPNSCDDANDCTEDSCNEGADSCKYTKAQNGSSCEDGSACTSDDTCSNGVCEAGPTRECTDDNVCTDDSCDAATGDCVFTNNTAPCDDGAFCTTGDTCSEGICTGGPGNGCDDGNGCTIDSCDEETDGCSYGNADNGTVCDDGLFCTLDDVCTDGVCAGPTENTCDDGNSCTKDSCNEGSNDCKYSPTANNDPCDDGSFCTVDDTCQSGACEGVARDCDDQNGCTDDSCNEDGDTCDNANNSAPCDDGQYCTTGDTCGGGTCSVFSPTCDDANVCTTDSCDENADTCSNENNTNPCEDGEFCTVSDTCSGGACGAGPARDCGDANACTDDSCNEGTDVCDNVNNTAPCDDGLFCTVSDVCAAGTCGGAPKDCGDGNVCTSDVCDEGADSCTNPNNTDPCEDGLFCTTGDTCAAGACVAGPVNDCNDANGCTDDACNEDTDSCDNVNNTDPCDSGVFCVIDGTCAGGECVGTPRLCGDQNDCTDDSCDEDGDACVNAPNTDPCDDGLYCTEVDACSGGICTGTTRDCGDDDVCTDDVCNELGDSCENPENTAPCEDGLFCTAGDACAAGVCVAGPPNPCDDSNACTDNECDEELDLCLSENNTEDCDDGDVCTSDDVCSGGVCTGMPIDPCSTTTTTTSTTTSTVPCDICGDVNMDCMVKAGDAQTVLRAAVNLPTECTIDVCDYNGDGKISTVDALATLRDAVGLTSNPQCPALDQ